MAQVCDASSPFSGEVEVILVRAVSAGRKGRGAGSKTMVFGILERQGKVCSRCRQKAATGCDPGQGIPRSIILSDGWRGYNGLVDVGYEKHLLVHHGKNEFARGNFHINGIESFWSYAKRRLAKFNRVPRHTFHLHFKECEFGFNHREENICGTIDWICSEKIHSKVI